MQQLGAKLLRKHLVLAMTDADATAPVAKPLHLEQQKLQRPSCTPAFSEHLKRTFGTGLSHSADSKNAGHRCRQLADPPVLGQVVHGFQSEKQMRLALIRLQDIAYGIKVYAGAQFRRRLFDEKGDLRTGRKRVEHLNAAGRVMLFTAFFCRAGNAVAAGESTCNGKCDHIAVLAECLLPVCHVRAGTVGATVGVTERTDHSVNIERCVVPEFLCFGADGERDADKVHSAQGKKVAAGVCDKANLIHGVSSESQEAFYPVL